MALPFKNSVATTMPGFASASFKGSATQTITSNATNTIVIGATTTTPSAGGTPFNPYGSGAPSQGKWRFRVVNMTATAVVALTVTVSDGTNTWQVANIPGNAAGVTYLEYTNEFITDIAITSVNFVVVTTGTTTSCPVDVEIAMN
jgi:hypothetical protein